MAFLEAVSLGEKQTVDETVGLDGKQTVAVRVDITLDGYLGQ